MMKLEHLRSAVGLVSAILLIPIASAIADNWFMLGEKPIKSADASTEIKAEEGNVEGGYKEDKDLRRGR